jgi:hypothetical protein
MTVRANKPAFNIREKLKELTHSVGLKGRELMGAATVQDARDLVSAGRKNLLINGAMQVAQRGTSGTGSGYTSVDRFKLSTSSPDVTLSQGSLTSGSPYDKGFRNFLRVTNTSTTTATNGYRELDYSVEAQDLANSGWVISNSNSHATISFWVRSSVSQRFYMYIRCVDGTAKSYTFPFDTIANTWVKVEQTIPGDSTLTVNNDNGQGLLIRFVVHYGTTYTGSGATNNVWRVTGSDYTQDMSTSFALTAGATFDVTGLQLEAGKNATEFEHRSYGEELALCQRYFQYFPAGAIGRWNNATQCELGAQYPVPMRTTPTTTVNPNDAVCNLFRMGITVNQSTISSVNNAYMNASGGVLIVNVSATSSTPSAGDLAAYDPDGDSHCIFLSAEL